MTPFRMVVVLCFCLFAIPAGAQPAPPPEEPAQEAATEPGEAAAEAAQEAATEPGEAAAEPAQEQGPRWYYRVGKETEGPVSTSGLLKLLEQKVINGGTLITRKAWQGTWTYPGHVDLFSDKVVWFYASGAGKKGPVSTHRMGQLLVLKLVAPDNLAWRSGMKAWRPVASLPELATPPAKLGPSPIKGADAPTPAAVPAPTADARQAEANTGDMESSPIKVLAPKKASTVPALAPEEPPRVAPVRRVKRTKARRNLLLLGPGMSLGFFSPGDVNKYMKAQLGSATVQEGFSGMFINIVPRISVGYAPIEYVQITAVGEVGWGPKIIETRGSSTSTDTYHFVRYSGGATITGHIPIKDYRFSLFGGAGVLFHWMSFEQFEAGAPGARALLGFRVNNRVFTPEIVLMFDYAHATYEGSETDPYSGVVTPITFDLNYTGVTIGVNFHFKVLGN